MGGNNENEVYEYKNNHLVGSVLIHLLPKIFGGSAIDTKDIFPAIEKYHLDHGGLPARAKDTVDLVQKALKMLIGTGHVKRIGHARYIVEDVPDKYEGNIIPKQPLMAKPSYNEAALDQEAPSESIVYAYSFRTYRKAVSSDENPKWPIKVGKSRKGIERIHNQCGTSFPEPPEIYLTIRANHPEKLERFIHSVFRISECTAENAPGSEWFLTNPKIIEGLAQIYKNQLCT